MSRNESHLLRCLGAVLILISTGRAQNRPAEHAAATGTSIYAPAGMEQINHIIFLAQENRSLDHYFGALRKYWADNGYADASFDGLPQYNPTSGLPPLYGPPPTNPGCDPNYPPP